jgi:hypothetical protein
MKQTTQWMILKLPMLLVDAITPYSSIVLGIYWCVAATIVVSWELPPQSFIHRAQS